MYINIWEDFWEVFLWEIKFVEIILHTAVFLLQSLIYNAKMVSLEQEYINVHVASIDLKTGSKITTHIYMSTIYEGK